MKLRLYRITTALLGLALLIGGATFAHGQVIQPHLQQDKNGRVPMVNDLVSYSPADLGVNSTAIAASGSYTTKLINTNRIQAITLSFNCTQVETINIIAIAEDQVTTLGTYAVDTSAAVGWQQVYVATELAPNVTSGTQTVPFRFPQPYIQIQFVNTVASAETCTARLYTRF